MTEVAQLAGDFNSGSNFVASGLPKFKSIKEAGYVLNSPETVAIQTLPDISHDNIRIEVENCIAALAERGYDVYVVDTKHPELDIPAFYTIIPGAHFRERSEGTSVGMFSAKLMSEKYDPATAFSELEKIETLLPGKYYTRFYMGSALLALGKPEEALPYYQKALDVEPKDEDIPSIYSYMGVCLKEVGKFREAVEVLEKGASYDSDRTDIYNLLGFCHFKLKAHERAIDAFNKVIRLDPSSAIDYANIGSNYREMGQTQKAIEYYEAALALDPTIQFALENLLKLQSQKEPG